MSTALTSTELGLMALMATMLVVVWSGLVVVAWPARPRWCVRRRRLAATLRVAVVSLDAGDGEPATGHIAAAHA